MVGEKILYNFFPEYFHKIFLKIFNLGNPDILKINLHSNLNKIKYIKGNDEIK